MVWEVESEKQLSDGTEVTLYADGGVDLGAFYQCVSLDSKSAKQLAKWLQKKVLK